MRYQIKFPSNLLMLGKTIVIIESVVTQLDPEFEILSFSKPYTAQLLRQKLEPRRWLQDIYDVFDDVSYTLKELPLQLNQILRKLQKGKLKLDIELPGIDRLTLELDKVSNRLSFSLIISALISPAMAFPSIISAIATSSTKLPVCYFDYPVPQLRRP